MPTLEDWAYLAGMIDGEGSIMLPRHRARERHPTWFYYEPTLEICGTCKSAIKSIADDFNGHFYTVSNKQGYGGNKSKELHRVHWQAQPVVANILRRTIPHLRIRREQAEFLLEYCESRLNRPTHKASLSKREAELHFLIKGANHK